MNQTLNINGVGEVQYTVSSEYVDPTVSAIYMQSMETIQAVLSSVNPSQTINGDYDNFYSALQNLQNLAKNGAQNPDVTNVTNYMTQQMVQNYQSVISALQTANISLTASTATDATKDGLIQNVVNNWQALKGFGLNEILTTALGAYTDSRSLQSYLELEYVKTGNDVLLDSLTSLENALSANQNSLSTLTIIQNLSNKVQVDPTGTFNFPPKTLADIPSAALTALLNSKSVGVFYNGLHGSVNASGTAVQVTGIDLSRNLIYLHDLILAGGVPDVVQNITAGPTTTIPQSWAFYPSASEFLIDPNVNNWTVKPDPTLLAQQTGFASAINTIANASILNFEKFYKLAASAYFKQEGVHSIASTSDVTSLLAAKSALLANIASVEALNVNPPNNRNTPNTLAYFLYKVVSDISAAFVGASTATLQFSALNKWIIDNQNVLMANASGPLAQNINQGDISLAVTASQSLNQSQQAKVQQAMFIFQQYYQSSSSVLQSINQLITSMAQAINR
jgi:hypothetical protein